MEFDDIPTHDLSGATLSKWGRISTYAQAELTNINRRLVFSQLDNEKELIERLETVISNINKLQLTKQQ